jgi:hypothetical protein
MIDKRITLALIFAMAIETAGGLLWTGRAAARLEAVERQQTADADTAERLARIETELADMRRILERLERRTEQRGGAR